MNALVNVSTVVRHMKVGRSSIYKWYEAGKSPGYRLGRCLRVDLGKLLALMRRQTNARPRRSEGEPERGLDVKQASAKANGENET